LTVLPIQAFPARICCSANFRKKNQVKNIFVGNLSFDATESAVRSMFEEYGTVDRVNIVTDRDTGRARGFGFVEMGNDGEGEKAIAALNGRDMDGRALNVNEARPKENRAGGGGGYRGNGGGGGRRQNRW
jgi:cold-inducible RNA-binding protein